MAVKKETEEVLTEETTETTAETKLTKAQKDALAKKSQMAYLNERVPVTLQRPEGEKIAHRTITVNGVNYQIQYGRQVMVPRFVKNVIDESVRNAEKAREKSDAVLEEQAKPKY